MRGGEGGEGGEGGSGGREGGAGGEGGEGGNGGGGGGEGGLGGGGGGGHAFSRSYSMAACRMRKFVSVLKNTATSVGMRFPRLIGFSGCSS